LIGAKTYMTLNGYCAFYGANCASFKADQENLKKTAVLQKVIAYVHFMCRLEHAKYAASVTWLVRLEIQMILVGNACLKSATPVGL